MSEKLLPIGTVVKIVSSTQPMVICGYCPVSTVDNKVSDYSLIGYPNGFFENEGVLQVDRDMIAEVVYEGYMNSNAERFLEKLEEDMPSIKNDAALTDNNQIS